jgi:SAM-dependent methyltransferase
MDAVFSNAALHWVPAASQDAVADCVSRALRPGGRFVAELGGKGNISTILSALCAALEAVGGLSLGLIPNPWFFPSVGEYAGLLERHNLAVVDARLFDRPTPLENGERGMREWIEMFARGWLALAPSDLRPAVIADTERRLRESLYHDGEWVADYRRLRLVALREG